MKNLVIFLIGMTSLSAYAWSLNLGVVTIGGGGKPVLSPGSISVGIGGGKTSGSSMAPTEPGRQAGVPQPPIFGPMGPRDGLGGRPYALPPIGAGVNLAPKVVQFFDAMQDVGSIGKHGRDRDRERAQNAEQLAKTYHDGVEKAKAEKKNGIQKNLDQAIIVVRDWEDFMGRAPKVMTAQEGLIELAQKELKSRELLAVNLRAAKNSNQDATLSLRLIGGLLNKRAGTAAAVSEDGSNELQDSLSTWATGFKTIEETARNANLSASEFLTRAIASADETALTEFVQQVGEMRAQVQGLLSIGNEKLLSARLRKEGYERELSTLQ